MTNKRVFGILAVIALLAVSATGAEAGAGGTPSALTSFFLCKSISGQDAGRRVDVDSTDPATGSGWGSTLLNVRVGVATLACSFARLYDAGTRHIACDPTQPPNPDCTEISPIPVDAQNNPVLARDLKCYAISVSKGQQGNPMPPSYTVNDGLVGIDKNVNGSSMQYICAPATFNQNIPQ
jgi:hypothetical protein